MLFLKLYYVNESNKLKAKVFNRARNKVSLKQNVFNRAKNKASSTFMFT